MSTKRKAPTSVAQPTAKPSAMAPSKTRVNESRATVATSHKPISNTLDTIEISSDSPSSDDDDDSSRDGRIPETADSDADMADGAAAQDTLPAKIPAVNGARRLDNEQKEVEDDVSESDAEPAFGELIQAHEPIDVSAALSQPPSTALQTQPATGQTSLAAPSLSSLSTVLAQALQSDDSDLLESCLHITHVPAIRNTIERLDSGLVGVLLSKLATRLHRRPGRAGTLMVWVQWAIVAHGGALAAQADVVERLQALQKVLAERARGLNSLLVLKGKLDMLDAQMKLRRRAERSAGQRDDGEEEGVVYVEGDETMAATRHRERNIRGTVEINDDEEPLEEGLLPVTNGIIGDSDDEEDDEEDDESDEASEANEADQDEDEVQFDDVDEGEESLGEDEDSEAEAPPPPKKQKVGGPLLKRR